MKWSILSFSQGNRAEINCTEVHWGSKGRKFKSCHPDFIFSRRISSQNYLPTSAVRPISFVHKTPITVLGPKKGSQSCQIAQIRFHPIVAKNVKSGRFGVSSFVCNCKLISGRWLRTSTPILDLFLHHGKIFSFGGKSYRLGHRRSDSQPATADKAPTGFSAEEN